MKILLKQLILDKPDSLTLEYIENHILELGFKPLRWAITGIKDNKLVLDAVVILD